MKPSSGYCLYHLTTEEGIGVTYRVGEDNLPVVTGITLTPDQLRNLKFTRYKKLFDKIDIAVLKDYEKRSQRGLLPMESTDPDVEFERLQSQSGNCEEVRDNLQKWFDKFPNIS